MKRDPKQEVVGFGVSITGPYALFAEPLASRFQATAVDSSRDTTERAQPPGGGSPEPGSAGAGRPWTLRGGWPGFTEQRILVRLSSRLSRHRSSPSA